MILRHTHIAALSIVLWNYLNPTPPSIPSPLPSSLPGFLRSLWHGLPDSSYHPLWQPKRWCPCPQHAISSRSHCPSLSSAPEAAWGSNTTPPSFFLLPYFPDHAGSQPSDIHSAPCKCCVHWLNTGNNLSACLSTGQGWSDDIPSVECSGHDIAISSEVQTPTSGASWCETC